MIKKVRYLLEYGGLRAVMFLLNMFSDKHIHYIASIFGILWYYLDPKHRSIAKKNISYAFPDMSKENRNKILIESYKNIIESFITFPRIKWFNNSNIDKYFEFQCEDYYTEAVKKGRGVFILTGHLGNWEFAAAAQSLRHGGLIAVAKDIHNPYIDRYIKSVRKSAGIEVVRPRNAVFKLLRALKQGKTIAMLLDQNTLRHEAVFVNFFGKPAATQYAMALMALKTGATVVPGYIVKNYVSGGYIIRYEKPFFVDSIEDKAEREKMVIELTQRFTTTLENQIKRAPGQWFWVHNRFKTTPLS
jgi:KDO2-lipid IV(A) lauroyltransferase